jgi:pyrroloquinoline quinone (PQQ) biosynthesis protein C
MSFYHSLLEQTAAERAALNAAPLITRALGGNVTLPEYVGFLGQAYHHVKQTVPLLMAVGARLPEEKEWLRAAVAEYIEEEYGHQEWILSDIAACGYDKEAARRQSPHPATELMVAYAYDMVQRIAPIGFFGMVHVLEGTSIALADRAAQMVGSTLGLPDNAFSYLRSHGALDVGHVAFFQQLMDRIDEPAEQHAIVHAANMFYRLYRGVFDSVVTLPCTIPRSAAPTEAGQRG